jgi:hypothetical protein
MAKPKLTEALILAWADAHFGRNGRWPSALSGAVAGAPGETWGALASALRNGCRSLPGGDSLARLLARERGVGRRGWHGQGRRWCAGR